MDLIKEIIRGLEKPGKNRVGLAEVLGRTPATVTEMLKPTGKRRRIRADEVPKIREYLGLDPIVPIVGSVGASSEAHFYGENADDPSETVAAPAGASPDTVAVEIRGDSLGTGFNGWLAFYDDRREPLTPDLIGKLCILGISDGRVLIKIPKPARTKGFYHLFSGFGGDPIPDVKVEWAALVRLIAPKS